MLFQSNPLAVANFIQKHQSLKQLGQEVLLDLQMSVMDEPEANEHVSKCDDYLHIKGQNLSMYLCDSLPMDKLQALFAEATGKRRNTDKYITCLLIHLATDGESLKVSPVYQPVYLKRSRYDDVTQKDLYTIPAYGYGNYYVFDRGVFNAVSEGQKEALIKNYQRDMTLIHTIQGSTYATFDPDSDVMSCLVPFQLIYKLLDETPSEVLFVTNAIREIGTDEVSPIKHIVIVSGESLEEVHMIPAKYANRSHLCPPCSTIFGFDLA